MTPTYTGNRKGISLVEMIVAIILFATLAAIGLKYTKSYINTDIQAKKARIAAVTDQANQLLQAYQIYVADMGVPPALITDLNGSSQIMSELPAAVTEIASAGWKLNAATAIAAYPTAFYLDITAGGAGKVADEQYCALLNREINSSVDLNVSDGTLFFTGADVAAAYTASGNKKAFCWSSAADTHQIVILVP